MAMHVFSGPLLGPLLFGADKPTYKRSGSVNVLNGPDHAGGLDEQSTAVHQAPAGQSS
jgi:hypothetical protein